MVAPPRTRRGPTTTGKPAWHQPRPHSGRPRRRRHGPASWVPTPMGTVRHQRSGGTPQPSFRTLPGAPQYTHPYRTSTSLPTMRGPSTSSCPTTSRPKRGTRRHASPNSSPIPHCTTTYRRPTSSSPTTRAATTTTSTPRMSAPPSPYTPSPPTLASSQHDTTRVQHASIHYTSPRPRAKGPPTTRPLQPTAPASTQPADGRQNTTKITCSHALALDPAPSPRPPTNAP